MNVDRILELADILERDEPPLPGMAFDMREYFQGDSCGSVACMAGWAFAMFCNADLSGAHSGQIFAEAAGALGLSATVADELFMHACDEEGVHSPMLAEGADAARLLRHLAATGEVDWRKAYLTVPR